MLATLFFNFVFWYEEARDFDLFGSPGLYVASLIGSAVLIAGLFYLGPAAAAQTGKRSLMDLVAASVGSIPAWLFRVCSTLFSIGWLMALLGTTAFIAFQWPFRRMPTNSERVLSTVGLAAFLFATGLQSIRTEGKLAFFTNKLAMALLVAAVIRTRDDLPTVWYYFTHAAIGYSESVSNVWRGFSAMLVYAAPWALLGAGFGRRCETKREVVLIGSLGIVLPIIVATGIVAFVSQATHSRFRNIAAALWYRDSARYVPAVTMLAAVTMFGMVRLGVRNLAASIFVLQNRRAAYRIVFTILALGTAILSGLARSNQFSFDLVLFLAPIVRALVAVAAILAADAILGHRPTRLRRIDWIGVLAFFAGWGAPCYLPDSMPGMNLDEHFQPWLLPSYAIAFIVAVGGRSIQKIRNSGATTPALPPHHV